MNVFYTVNDAFVPQLGAALCSVCENNRDMDSIVLHVGELGVTEEHREQLRTLAAGYGREISFISVEGLRERLGFEFDTLGWSEIVVARLLLDTLLPEDVDRVLYLDGDTIVTGSLRELWETDMEGKAIAASAASCAT